MVDVTILRRVVVSVGCLLLMLNPTQGEANGAVVTVTLIKDGKPARIANHPVYAHTKSGEIYESKTNSLGQAFLEDIPPGEYWIDLGAGNERRWIKIEQGKVQLRLEIPVREGWLATRSIAQRAKGGEITSIKNLSE